MKHYISEVEITNVQSHAHTVVKLNPGVNAFTGPTDNGKSAVLRAIRWCLWNIAVEGGQLIRLGETKAAVKVTFSDGIAITRAQDKKRNSYTLDEPGKEPQSFYDFGTKVPAEILKAHGMPPVRLDPEKNDTLLLNMATQLESPFFIGPSTSAGARSRILGRLAGVNVIDVAGGDANSDLIQYRKDVAKAIDDQQRVDDQLLVYAGVDDEDRLVAQGEALLRRVPPIIDELNWLQNTVATLADLGAKIKATEARLHQVRHATEAAELIQRAEAVNTNRTSLVLCRERYQKVAEGLTRAANTVQKFARQPEAQRLLQEAEALNVQRAKLLPLQDRHQTVTTGMARTRGTLQRLGRQPDAIAAVEEALKAQATLQTLRWIDDTRRKVMAGWKPTKERLKRFDKAPEAVEAVRKAEAVGLELTMIRNLSVKVQGVQARIEATTHNLTEATRKASTAAILQQAAAAQDEMTLLRGLASRLAQANDRLTRQQQRLTDLAEDLAERSTEYGQALQEAGICPTCLQPVTAHVAAEIAQSLIHGEVPQHVS